MNLDRYPALKKAHEKLLAEREAIRADAAPYREARQKLLDSIAPVLAEVKRLESACRVIEQPRLGEIENELAAIARAAK